LIKGIYKTFLPLKVRIWLWNRRHDLRLIFTSFRTLYRKYLYDNSPEAYSELQLIYEYESLIKSKNLSDFKSKLESNGISYFEGEFQIFITKNNLSKVIKSDYEKSFGLKIIKSTEFGDCSTPMIMSKNVSDSSTYLHKKLVGSVSDVLTVENLLYHHNLSPRVFDLIKLKLDDAVYFGLIVEDYGDEFVYGSEAETFLKDFFGICENIGIDIVGGEDQSDFKPPKFKNNIVRDQSTKKIGYVDIQNFYLNKSHFHKRLQDKINTYTPFGEKSIFKKGLYAYQGGIGYGIKGKRDSELRLEKTKILLNRNNVSLIKQDVLDVGCNLGLFLFYSLSEGAKYACGLDTPEIAPVTRELLFSKSFTRFDVFGEDLRKAKLKNLKKKKFNFVFYMSIEKHIGFPEWFTKLSIDWMLYEGHEGENHKILLQKLKAQNWDKYIVDKDIIADGDSLKRPIFLLDFSKK